MRENDTSTLQYAIEGQEIGGDGVIILPVGTAVTIALTLEAPGLPKAYEVEAYIQAEDKYYTATVEADALR